MKLQANILLRILTPLILLAGSILLFHACQDRKTTPSKSSEPATPLSQDELKALGIEGDTPADTVATLVGQMKLWRKELETVKASNAALLQENQRLREREQNTDSRLNDAINRQQTSASEQQNELLSSLQTQIQQLKGNRTTDDSLAGLGIDEPEASFGEPLRWIAPADALPADKNGRPLQPALAFPSTMQNAAPQPETPPPAAVKPVYTLPQNSTLIGSVAMTALLGRIPLNGSVTDPYPFKVLIGRDNLTANGIELPDIEGAVISGSATGDWTLSCVRGSLTSITFVFRDGTVRTLPAEGDKTGTGTEGNIGWLSDPHGLPCIPGERKSNAAEYIGSQFLLTIVVWPQDRLEEHLSRLSDRAIGENVESEYTKKDCQEVRHWLKDGHKLYRSALAFYLSAPDNGELTRRVRSLNSLLLNAGMVPVQENDELAPLSSWLRWLPMCFNPARDKRQLYTRFSFVQHLANLLPLFGRESGTGHPGVSYFNRGGGMLCWDPLNREDRAQNGHLLLLGPTGAGKSATLNAKIAQLMALHRPRLFIVEAGNSFGLMADYAREHGLTVNKISLKPGSGITLPLFADAWKLAESDAPLPEPDDDDPEDADNEQRDLLGEMEITARLMITGGELKEDARLTRSDRALIREAILHAAQLTAHEKRQTLTQDIRDALFTLAQDAALPESRRNRLWEMGEAMNMFCSGFEGELFNREGKAWPEADITLVDLAMFAREGYEAQLAIAYISLINHINNLGERDQHLARPIVNITDEAHIITVNPLLARFLTKGSKMWRKLGIWLWLATQNLSDFPDDAKKLLNMIEWWELLVMPPEEVEQVSRFKSLTPEQRQLLLSATKAPGKYTEGVVLSPRVEALFRVVSPALWLALGMTEKHEKAERMRIMIEFGCSELEAAMRVAGIEVFY
ncbi:conjugative transfer ATPase [Salmonella enterica]|nr:conjugative transfer ATPase [Salmonella enterica]